MGLPAEGAPDADVEVAPPDEGVVLGEPRHRAHLALARGDEPASLGDAPHLAQRADLVADMLEDLVRVHDVERPVGEVERVDVAHDELDVRDTLCCGACAGLDEDLWAVLDADDVSLGDKLRKVDAYRARATADIQDAHPRLDMWQEIRSRVLNGAAFVRTQDRLLVPIDVCRCRSTSHGALVCLALFNSYGQGSVSSGPLRTISSIPESSGCWLQMVDVRVKRGR